MTEEMDTAQISDVTEKKDVKETTEEEKEEGELDDDDEEIKTEEKRQEEEDISEDIHNEKLNAFSDSVSKKRTNEDDDQEKRRKKKKRKHHPNDETSSDKTSKKKKSILEDPYEQNESDDFMNEIKNYALLRSGRKEVTAESTSNSSKTDALCVQFLEGTCTKGKMCQYSHNVKHNHMGVPSHLRKMELCKFYLLKCCAKKQKCLYMHKDFPCKFYHTGIKCVSSDVCQFSHEPLSEVTSTILTKHLEMAPKEILGSFPRLSQEAAENVITVTEMGRSKETVPLSLLERVREHRGKGFKYVDRALKSHLKKLREQAAINVGAEQSQLLTEAVLWPKMFSKEESPKRNNSYGESMKDRESGSTSEGEEEKESNELWDSVLSNDLRHVLNEKSSSHQSRHKGSSQRRTDDWKESESEGHHIKRDENRHRRRKSPESSEDIQSNIEKLLSQIPPADRELFRQMQMKRQEESEKKMRREEKQKRKNERREERKKRKTEMLDGDEEEKRASDSNGDAQPNLEGEGEHPTTSGDNQSVDISKTSLTAILQFVKKSKEEFANTISNEAKSFQQDVQPPESEPPKKYDPMAILKEHIRKDQTELAKVNSKEPEAKEFPNSLPAFNVDKINLPTDLSQVLSDLKNRSNKIKQTSNPSHDIALGDPSQPSFSNEVASAEEVETPKQDSDYRQLPWRTNPPETQKLWATHPSETSKPWETLPAATEPKQITSSRDPRSKDPRIASNQINTSNGDDENAVVNPSTANSKGEPIHAIEKEPSLFTEEDSNSDPVGDLDFRQLESRSLLENPYAEFEDEPAIPFHVPSHAPVNVVNGSITAHAPFQYRLVLVAVESINYSHITSSLEEGDSRIKEDPRLFKFFHKKDEKEVPQPVEEIKIQSPPPSEPPPVENRDPRAARLNRDPRMVDKVRNNDPRLSVFDAMNNDPRLPKSLSSPPPNDIRLVDPPPITDPRFDRSLSNDPRKLDKRLPNGIDPMFDRGSPSDARVFPPNVPMYDSTFNDPRVNNAPNNIRPPSRDPRANRNAFDGPFHPMQGMPPIRGGGQFAGGPPMVARPPNGMNMQTGLLYHPTNGPPELNPYATPMNPQASANHFNTHQRGSRFLGPHPGERQRGGESKDPRLQKTPLNSSSFSPPVK